MFPQVYVWQLMNVMVPGNPVSGVFRYLVFPISPLDVIGHENKLLLSSLLFITLDVLRGGKMETKKCLNG